jgi:hypothetical protein
VEAFGDQGAVELTGLLRYYTLLSTILNGFEIEVPDDAVIPWANIKEPFFPKFGYPK